MKFDLKFKIIKESIRSIQFSNKLYTVAQIYAAKDFGNVKKGQLGGYITTLNCLSQHGNCWINEDAYVLDNATIIDDAVISKGVMLSNVIVGQSAKLKGPINISAINSFQINSMSEIVTLRIKDEVITIVPKHQYIHCEIYSGTIDEFIHKIENLPKFRHYMPLYNQLKLYSNSL